MLRREDTGALLKRRPRDDELDVFGLTHQGFVRPTNQDHFLTATLGAQPRVLQTSVPNEPELMSAPENGNAGAAAFLAMVADGVGSTGLGEEASRVAVEEVTARLARSVQHCLAADPTDDAAFQHALELAAQQCHAELRRQAQQDAGRRGMATTLTLWLGVWPRAYLLQVGDSRYYRLYDGELMQVSHDQTVAQELIDHGVLSAKEAARTRWSNVLSSSLGGPHTLPAIATVPDDWSMVHLLCSDGLTKHLSDEQIRDHLVRMTSAQQACEDLLQAALDAGGRDNITIVIGRAVPRA